MDDSTLALRLYIEIPTSESPYAHIRLNFCPGPSTKGDLDFHGLQISNQIDGRRRDFGIDYGWKLRYQNIYSCDLATCEKMCKTLRTITRRYKAISKKLGEPTTFGHYAAYHANCLGIEHFTIMSNQLSIPDGIEYIDRRTKELHAECIQLQESSNYSFNQISN